MLSKTRISIELYDLDLCCSTIYLYLVISNAIEL